jgi:hypothetical protein
METTFKENSELKIIRTQSGREDKIVPLSMELEVKNGSDLYNSILYFSNFEKYKESELKIDILDNWAGLNSKRVEQLKEDLEGCKTKITIKIELEKYERT